MASHECCEDHKQKKRIYEKRWRERKKKTKQSPRLVTLLAHSFAFWLHLTRARACVDRRRSHCFRRRGRLLPNSSFFLFRPLSTPRIINFFSVFFYFFSFSFSICYFNSIWNTIYYLFSFKLKLVASLPCCRGFWENEKKLCSLTMVTTGERENWIKVSILWAAHTHTHRGGEIGCRIHQIVSFYFV